MENSVYVGMKKDEESLRTVFFFCFLKLITEARDFIDSGWVMICWFR